MKKILFFAGLLAFVTSCTDDELISSGSYNQELPNGISFSTELAEIPESRGMLTYDETTEKFPFFWYAEQDEINVYPFGEVTTKTYLDAAGNAAGDTIYVYVGDASKKWAKIESGLQSYTYKATQSQSDGKFTAKSPESLLVFADSTASNKKNAEAAFAATYNAELTMVTFDKDHKIDTITIKPVVDLYGTKQADADTLTQDYAGGKNVTDYIPMYAVNNATQTEEYNSVGEKLGLTFYRHGAILGFRSEGIDATYKSLFGKLETITLTMLGNDTLKPSALAYKQAPSYRIAVNAPVDFGKNKSSITNAGKGDSIPAIQALYSKAWGDGDVAYMAIAPVVRNNNKEKYEITYEFENITFTTDSASAKNWAYATNGVANMPKLDMADHKFLVINGENDTYSMLVNSGSFDDCFVNTANNDSTKLTWKIGGTNVTVDKIDTLISKVALTEAQQKRLAKFPNLVYLQLDETTSLAKGALACADDLKTLNMPKVTTIAEDFSSAALNALDSLLLPAYAYGDADVNALLITSSLKKIDMSAVESVTESFYNDAPLTFNGMTSLQEVKVKDNLKVEVPNFFKGTGLTKVEGKIDITNAPGIFEGVTTLDSVAITGTVIPERAFNGATAIAKVAVNGAQVKPTTVGADAFKKTTALTTMDLSATTTIGANAFSGSGLAYSAKDVALMTVGATTIGDMAFAANGLAKIDFVNATKIGANILFDTYVTAVQFQKAFTVDETATTEWHANMFGKNSAKSVTLYVAKNQKYVSGNSLLLPYVNGDGDTVTKKIDFLKITVAAQ